MKLDHYDFYCPQCKSRVDSSGVIHLKTRRSNGDKGDVYLSTTFGDFNYKHNPNIAFENKELVDFSCPNCSTVLHSKDQPKFVSLTMKVENKFDFEVLFSRQSGIQKTYIKTEDGMECYGKDCRLGAGD